MPLKETPDLAPRAVNESRMSLEDILERDPELKMGPELVSRFAIEIIEAFHEKGLTMHTDVDAVYKRPWGRLLVRRESPQRLVGALVDEKDVELSFRGTFGEKYLNSAVWDPALRPETLRWAIQEGFSKGGGLFMVEAFDPSGRDLLIEQIDNPIKQLKVGGEVIDRTTYRAASGKIHPEDMRFVLMGVVTTRFPREQMTEDEVERLEEFEVEMEEWRENPRRNKRPDPVFVLRAFTFDRETLQEAA